jgi:hypothetical protein
MRRKLPATVIGLGLIVPDGVVFADRLTGDPVVRCRTEQQLQIPPNRLTPVLTPA